MKRILFSSAVVTLLLGLAILFLFIGALARTDLTYPSVHLGENGLGLLTREEVKNGIYQSFLEYQQKPLLFAFEGEAVKVTPQELGVTFDEAATFRRVPFAGSRTPFGHFFETLVAHRVKPVATVEEGLVQKILEEKFTTVKFMHNARFRWDEKAKTVLVMPEETGITVDTGLLMQNLKNRLNELGNAPIFLHAKVSLPTIIASDLEEIKANFVASLPKKIALTYAKKKWDLKFPKAIGLIDFEKREGQLAPVFSDKNLETILVDNGISSALEFLPDGLKMYLSSEGKVVFEGHGKPGKKIERNVLAAALGMALSNRTETLEIPVSEMSAPLDISDDLKKMGIEENISRGYTTYYGSPKNRILNISVGVAHYDGTLIAPSEIFSFNDHLGPVDATTGYKEELVIKHDGTKPEFGGGLCQVSTTFYRGAILAGLPIIERSPHTYAVTYYSQILGHGLDATIYPGSHDLKFKNDTAGFLAVHAYVEGQEAHFDFYGTNDGRKIYLEGPTITNRKDSPPDETVYTKDKPDGQRELKEKAHPGFDATWYRFVTKNGEVKKETIFSHYKAMPNKYLVGGEGPAHLDADTEAAKQFE